jgi:hypothetical protein
VSRSTASYKPEHHPVQSSPSHVITTPNGPARLQGESGVAVGELDRHEREFHLPAQAAVPQGRG